MATKPTAKKASPKSKTSGKQGPLQTPLQPSTDLAAVIGPERRSRGEV